jgi:hypothetical protein
VVSEKVSIVPVAVSKDIFVVIPAKSEPFS